MQDTDIKIKPRPSKLFLYERFYRDLEIFRKNNQNFAITEFACGASKILKSINPNFYQGIDLKEELISKSKETYENDNYKFFVGSMIDFNTKIKTNLGICIQTFGINLSTKGELVATVFISEYLPLQCKTKLQPAANAFFVFSLIEYFKLFIEISSEIIIFLKPIFFLIISIIILE